MRKFFYVCFVAVTVVTSIIYFIACLTPYVSPENFWPMAFLALGFPFLAVAILLLLLLWVFVKRKISLYLFLLFLVGFKNLQSTIAFNPAKDRLTIKDTNSLRILSWNVKEFDNPAEHADSFNSGRRKILRYINDSGADIVCLQELLEFEGKGFLSNIDAIKALGYPYSYTPVEVVRRPPYGALYLVSAIFSKTPILDSGSILMGDSTFPEKMNFADISFNGRTTRIFNTHFKSLALASSGSGGCCGTIFHGDSNFIYQASSFEKLKVFGQEHAKQAAIAKAFINASPHPVVFTADMNSVPTSFAYHLVSKNLQDVFLKQGTGLGYTMPEQPKTLRIDFIFADSAFQVKAYQQDKVLLSDHYPHITDLGWK